MRLTTAHKILIITALFCALIVSITGVYRYLGDGAVFDLVVASLSGAAVIGLGLYLRSFLRKLRDHGAS